MTDVVDAVLMRVKSVLSFSIVQECLRVVAPLLPMEDVLLVSSMSVVVCDVLLVRVVKHAGGGDGTWRVMLTVIQNLSILTFAQTLCVLLQPPAMEQAAAFDVAMFLIIAVTSLCCLSSIPDSCMDSSVRSTVMYLFVENTAFVSDDAQFNSVYIFMAPIAVALEYYRSTLQDRTQNILCSALTLFLTNLSTVALDAYMLATRSVIALAVFIAAVVLLQSLARKFELAAVFSNYILLRTSTLVFTAVGTYVDVTDVMFILSLVLLAQVAWQVNDSLYDLMQVLLLRSVLDTLLLWVKTLPVMASRFLSFFILFAAYYLINASYIARQKFSKKF
jgi:hypothetical protein